MPPLLWSREPRWLVKVQGEPQRWGTFGGSLRHPEPAALQQVQGGAHTVATAERCACEEARRRCRVDRVLKSCSNRPKKDYKDAPRPTVYLSSWEGGWECSDVVASAAPPRAIPIKRNKNMRYSEIPAAPDK